MKKEEIQWGDWHRILIGSAPGEFLWEVFLRTIIVYLVLLVILRLMGKRMGGMHTISELAVMITLGAIVSVPMQLPDRGILQGIVVLIFALTFQRGLNLLGWRSEAMERFIQGTPMIVLKNGVIVVEKLHKAKISRQQLYGVLRSKGIRSLGEVERMYIEPSGLFSVYTFDEPKPGLSISPPLDKSINQLHPVPEQKAMVCENCGMLATDAEPDDSNCKNCHHHSFQSAII